MKITVGHVLLVVGVGTYAFLGPMEGWEKTLIATADARNFAADKLPYMEFLRTADRKPKVVPVTPVPKPPAEKSPEPVKPVEDKPVPVKEAVALPPLVEDKLPAGEEPVKDKKISDVPPAPVVAEPVAEAPKKVPTHRRRKAAVKAAAAEPAKKSGKSAGNDLVGTYVSLTLKTGNVVKGMLVERTSTNYKIELPGMGAFDYPANTVKSIAAAE